jgi:hypothetical protein
MFRNIQKRVTCAIIGCAYLTRYLMQNRLLITRLVAPKRYKQRRVLSV